MASVRKRLECIAEEVLPAILLKKERLQHGCFLINLAKQTSFLQSTSDQLLLYDGNKILNEMEPRSGPHNEV